MKTLNYPGRIQGLAVGDSRGPSYLLEWWYVHQVTYDAALDVTRVRWSLQPPAGT